MRTKPVLVIIVTLIIGFMIGFLTSSQLRHKRMRSVRVFSSERYFREILYRVIEPTDEQKKKLEPILDRYGKDGSELQRDFRKKFDLHNDKYWEQIKAVLTPEQIELLNEMNRKREQEMRRFRPDSTRKGHGDWEERRGPPSHMRGEWDSLGRKRDTLISPDRVN